MKTGATFNKSTHEGLPAPQASLELAIAAPRVVGVSVLAAAGSNPRNLALNEVQVQPLFFASVVFGPTAVLTFPNAFPRSLLSWSAMGSTKPLIFTAQGLSSVTLKTYDASNLTQDVVLTVWGS